MYQQAFNTILQNCRSSQHKIMDTRTHRYTDTQIQTQRQKERKVDSSMLNKNHSSCSNITTAVNVAWHSGPAFE